MANMYSDEFGYYGMILICIISITKYIALDCEMVGVGVDGKESVLARVVIVNSYGNVIFDKFCRPEERITDFRTNVSGVLPEHLREGK